ncbi:tyrosine recombinase XerC [Rothia sp. ZJ932]|uniref:tyrosine recombinase XerC n=1 Tax=Rothia sp. ZJ932 TaxID=2810516 RepID=UPI001967B911|nr:tyrosine recombinase XerC [Rothia sp. ZJ932]QRZ62361.1 tyrosine recombinase XerC [Rothia sp. ZJ932]
MRDQQPTPDRETPEITDSDLPDTLVLTDGPLEYNRAYSQVIAEYTRYLTYEKHRSPETIRSYTSDLTAFLAYCNRYGVSELRVITRDHLRDWLASLHRHHAARSTMARRASCLRSFFAWAEEEQLIDVNPARTLSTPAKDRYLPEVLNNDHMQQLLRDVERSLQENPRDARTLRLAAVVELLYTTGMRISELTGLNLGSIDRTAYTLRVIGKGNKERIVPFGQPAMDALEQWVRAGRPQWFTPGNGSVQEALFIGPRGKRANPRQIREDINRLLAGLENTTASGAHIFRHTAATHLVDGGADIRTVQELLGHTNLATTQIYTHVSIDKLAGSYSKAHPRA